MHFKNPFHSIVHTFALIIYLVVRECTIPYLMLRIIVPSTIIKCLRVVKGSVEVEVAVAAAVVVAAEGDGEGEGDDINGRGVCSSCGCCPVAVVAHVQILQRSRGPCIAFLTDCTSFPASNDSGTVCTCIVCVCVCVCVCVYVCACV